MFLISLKSKAKILLQVAGQAAAQRPADRLVNCAPYRRRLCLRKQTMERKNLKQFLVRRKTTSIGMQSENLRADICLNSPRTPAQRPANRLMPTCSTAELLACMRV